MFKWLTCEGHNVVLFSDKLDADWCIQQKFDLAVSYTYRYILDNSILKALNYNVVNIHNSFLPWNRGADPNIWSILEDTPKGVTLHYMDENLDKGMIIAQTLVEISDNETLATSYDILDKEAQKLFKKAFAYYNYWPSLKKKAIGKGSYHSVADGRVIKECIDSYDLNVVEFRKRIRDLDGNI